MIRAHSMSLLTILVSLLLFIVASPATAVEPDYSIYRELLAKHVNQGLVDYDGLKFKEKDLDRFLDSMARADPASMTHNGAKAFFINLYNAWTIKLILGAYPDLKSIKDFGSLFQSPWQKKLIRLGGDVLTLDNIEHDILRRRFPDPRIHFAVNCASMGCPPLLAEPYEADLLEEQLERVTTHFINNPQRTRLDGKTLWVSKIMDWYDSDFGGDPVSFVRQYALSPLATRLDAVKESIEVKYIDYDWALNKR